jgi:hypothetical protein
LPALVMPDGKTRAGDVPGQGTEAVAHPPGASAPNASKPRTRGPEPEAYSRTGQHGYPRIRILLWRHCDDRWS